MDPWRLESGPWRVTFAGWNLNPTLESGPWRFDGPLDVGIWTPGGSHLDPWRLESGPWRVTSAGWNLNPTLESRPGGKMDPYTFNLDPFAGSVGHTGPQYLQFISGRHTLWPHLDE